MSESTVTTDDRTADAGGRAAPPPEAEGSPQEPASGERVPLSWPARAVALGGWLVVGLGVLGVLDRINHFAFAVPWMRVATWLAYSAGFHDLIIAPVVTVVALAIGRWLPPRVRGPVAGGLIVSGCLVAVSYPRLRGFGTLSSNASILPGNAAQDLIVVLGVVWLIVAATVAVRLVRAPDPFR